VGNGDLLLELVRACCLSAVDSTKPFKIVYGEVTGTSPLRIRIDQKLEVGEDVLILTNAVRDYHVFLEAYDNTAAYDDGGAGHHVIEIQNQDHSHEIKDVPVDTTVNTTVTVTAPQPGAGTGVGTGTGFANGRTEDQSQDTDHDHNYKGGVFKVKLGLKQGEQVVLLQVQGGQSYIVLDRVDSPIGDEGS